MERGGQLQFGCNWMGYGGWDVLGGVVWMLTGGGSCEEGDSVAASVERALTHPVFPSARAFDVYPLFCFGSVYSGMAL